jgi:hypothetical protein
MLAILSWISFVNMILICYCLRNIYTFTLSCHDTSCVTAGMWNKINKSLNALCKAIGAPLGRERILIIGLESDEFNMNRLKLRIRNYPVHRSRTNEWLFSWNLRSNSILWIFGRWLSNPTPAETETGARSTLPVIIFIELAFLSAVQMALMKWEGVAERVNISCGPRNCCSQLTAGSEPLTCIQI